MNGYDLFRENEKRPLKKIKMIEYYSFFEIRDYFKEKYPYFNETKVWQHIANRGDIYNGSYFSILVNREDIEDWHNNDLYGKNDAYIYFLELMLSEYGEDEYKFHVSW
jgi:hypothetical protein